MLRTLTLLAPALIPSWRFFDEIAPSPRIEYATLEAAQGTPTHWQELRPRPQRLTPARWFVRLFWNPRGNDALFLISCAERMLEAPNAHSEAEILKRIRRDLPSPSRPYFQFRIVLITRHGTELQTHIGYRSAIHQTGGAA